MLGVQPPVQSAVQTSQFVSQLERGFSRLRFDEPLEKAYVEHVRRDQQPTMMTAISLVLAIQLFYCLTDVYRLGLFGNEALDPDLWSAVMCCWLAVITLAWGGIITYRAGVVSLPVAVTVFAATGTPMAVVAVIFNRYGISHAVDHALIVVVMGAFVPIGLLFRQSVVMALGMTATVSAISFLGQYPEISSDGFYLTLTMLAAVAVGAVGGYARERADRQQFLLKGVLEHYALFDALTSLANRRYFQQHLATAVNQSRRTDERIACAMVDIDYFKQYNDSFGHAAGDEALKSVARVLAAQARRPMDIAARFGGEEFVVMFYGCGTLEAAALLRKFRSELAALAIAHPNSKVSPFLTVSIGRAQYRPGEPIDELLKRADKQLYRSKSEGRDRISFS